MGGGWLMRLIGRGGIEEGELGSDRSIELE
jgi:hypothetical protein